MNRQHPPVLICYDGSPGAARAISAAGTLMAGSPAIVRCARSGAAAEHIRIPANGTKAARRDLRADIRCAAQRQAAAVATEGTQLAPRRRTAGKTTHPEPTRGSDPMAQDTDVNDPISDLYQLILVKWHLP